MAYVANSDTRKRILSRLAEGVHVNGYQGLRTDREIEQLNITKGAFYHYFPDKISAGYAVIDEVFGPVYVAAWGEIEQMEGLYLERVVKCLERFKKYCTDKNVHLGHPIANLILEMSPLDEGYRTRLQAIVDAEHGFIEEALNKAKRAGELRNGVDVKALAAYVLSSLDASYGLAKLYRSKARFDQQIDMVAAQIRSYAK